MSARGHRLSSRPADGSAVGGIAHFQFVGVSEYTANAHKDPADVVTFDSEIDRWLSAGFAGMDVAEVSGLRRERIEAR